MTRVRWNSCSSFPLQNKVKTVIVRRNAFKSLLSYQITAIISVFTVSPAISSLAYYFVINFSVQYTFSYVPKVGC